MSRRILVIAGEVSGDMHAAGLIAALKQKEPDIEVFGVGGERMAELGIDLKYHVTDMAALGFAEVFPKLMFFRRVYNEMLELAKEKKPDAVLLVDYPGFNLRFAEEAHDMGLKVIYYICPQVWAWHKSRKAKMARIIDRLLVIFPFEPAVFSDTTLQTNYVGHPLLDDTRRALEGPEPEVEWTGTPRIAILPGSRKQEIKRVLPDFLKTASIIAEKQPDASFIIAAPTAQIASAAEEVIKRIGAPANCHVIEGQTREILRAARAALVASGTATLETGLMGCPMVIGYRIAPLSYFFLSRLVTVEYIGMINLVAGRALCKEFIQHNAKPADMAEALLPLLENTPERKSMLHGFKEVADKLGPPGSHAHAADLVLEELSSQTGSQD